MVPSASGRLTSAGRQPTPTETIATARCSRPEHRSFPCCRRSGPSAWPNFSATLSQKFPTGVRVGSSMCRCPLPTPPPISDHRQRIGGVDVRIGHARAVDDQRMIEQGAVAIRRGAQLLQELRVHARVIGVDLDHLRHLVRLVQVMRNGVVLLGDADLRIGALAEFARHHEGEHARGVGLISRRRADRTAAPRARRRNRARRWERPACPPESRRALPASECGARFRAGCRDNRVSRARSRAAEPLPEAARLPRLPNPECCVHLRCAPVARRPCRPRRRAVRTPRAD